MLYLVTGSNGTGKTLFTLKWVRELQLLWQKKHKINRPVYYDGFEIVPEIAEQFGWKHCDPTKWTELPDNSIIMVDECQRIYPTRSQGAQVPEHEALIATDHRKRGFDFFLVCQHPNQINTFIRHLIGSGWHRHIKRIFGMNRVNILEYNYAETNCDKPSGKSGAYRQMKLKFPKQVYKWYKSAVLHTSRVQIPPVVYYTILAGLVAVASVFYFYRHMMRNQDKPQETQQTEAVSSPGFGLKPSRNDKKNEAMTKEEYIQSFVPRIPPFLHTAPRYDEITKPVTAPFPAVCVYKVDSDICKCYTQQATPYQTDRNICIDIAMNGYFKDWDSSKVDRGVSGGNPSDQEPT